MGSASDFRNKDIIEQPLSASVSGAPGPPVSFRATVIPEEAILNAVYRHLKDLGADLTQEVALLAEAGTSYGKSAYGDTQGPLVLNFPMRLGRLRSTGGAEASHKAGASTPNGQGLLRLGLDELGAPSDLFPTFFPKIHNPSDEWRWAISCPRSRRRSTATSACSPPIPRPALSCEAHPSVLP